MKNYVDAIALQEYTTKLVAKLKTLFPGTPTAAETVADMTDHSKTYVYVGSESGYTAGDWYYWDGTAWTSGGPFQATSIITDTTLAVAGEAADAKATGDAIAAAKTAVLNAMAPAYSTSGTYAVGDYVNYNGAIYRCTTAITTAEAWTAGHWTAVTLGADLEGQVSDLKTQLTAIENLDSYEVNTLVGEELTTGRLYGDGTVETATWCWHSTQLINKDKNYYFDKTKYRIQVLNFDSLDQTTTTSWGGWLTEGIVAKDTNHPYMLFNVSTTSGSGTLSESDAEKALYYKSDYSSDLVGTVKKTEETLDNTLDLEGENVDTSFTIASGRLELDGTTSANSAICHTTEMTERDQTFYFDQTAFKIGFLFYNSLDQTVPSSQSGWNTSGAAHPANNYQYVKINACTLSGSGTIDLDTVRESLYARKVITNKLIDTVNNINARMSTIYVSEDGDNSNDGSAEHPLRTIQAAIDKDVENIVVEEGEYSPFVIAGKTHPVRIGMKDYTGTDKKIKITSESTTYPGVYVYNSADVILKNIWVDNVPRDCFTANNVAKITFIDCIASNNSLATFMGYRITDCNAYFKNCVAYNIVVDGFNFHNSGTSIMENCTAHDCADDGVSHHDNCVGYIIGGEFYNCGKGGVASPTYDAKTNVYNVYSHDNAYGLFADGNTDHPNHYGLVSNCLLINNATYDIYVWRGTVIGWNNIYETIRNEGSNYTGYNDEVLI